MKNGNYISKYLFCYYFYSFFLYLLIILSKQIRSTLKEQMEQKAQADKNELEINNRVTEMIIEQDRQYLDQEKQRQNERAKLLLQVTAKNKEVRK